MATNDEKRALANKELRNARNALLWVGIIMFVMDMVMIHAMYGDRLADDMKMKLTAISGSLLAAFVALYVFSKKRPRLCLTLGLVLFWGIQIMNMALDPDTIAKGLVLKIVFTVLLVKGLRSASHSEQLNAELERVFE